MSGTENDLDTAKKRKELEKLDIDITNAKATLSLERFKAWAALLGPVMTAATVLGTVYIGYLQISAKTDADEDTNWRQTISLLNDTKPEEFGARHVASLFKPFLKSSRYRTLAIGVTIDELPRLRDLGTYKDLFAAAFPKPALSDLPILLDLERREKSVTWDLQVAADAEKDENRRRALSDERNLVIFETEVLCDPIANLLRNFDHKTVRQQFSSGKDNAPKIPLDSIYFERCDFSNVDFSDTDLTNSAFDYVKLDGADLTNVREATDFLWMGIVWWTAKAIDADLLKILLKNYRPYMLRGGSVSGYRDGQVIRQADWEENIHRLCKSAQLTCTDADIRADFPKE